MTMQCDNSQGHLGRDDTSASRRIGAAVERTRMTSMRDVELFSEMTGDMNPLHYDAALAAETPFGALIVQGGVTSGLLECDRCGRPAGAGKRVPERRVAIREGGQGWRRDHRTCGGHQRARRQAHLHAGDKRAQPSGGHVPRWHRRHIYRTAGSLERFHGEANEKGQVAPPLGTPLRAEPLEPIPNKRIPKVTPLARGLRGAALP